MTHSVASGTLAAAVADAGTFTVNYPAGKNAGSFYLAMRHFFIVAGKRLNFPDDFDLTFGASNITVTNNSGTAWAIDSAWRLQLEEPGQREFREDLDRNRNGILPVGQPNLIASTVRGSVAFVNMGAPDTADPNGIVAGGAAEATVQTPTLLLTTLDVPRTLSAQGSAGSDHVITVTGKDVYGRTMVETLTLSGTTKIWGKKAFKTLTSVSVGAGAAGDTYDLGYEDILGLPTFLPSDAHVVGVMQDGVLLPSRVIVNTEIDQTRLLAGTSVYVLAPNAGFIDRASSVVTTAVGTGGSLTVEIETVAVTGLAVVVADSAAVGDVDTDVPTTVDGTDTTLMVAQRGDIEIVGDAAFATTGALTAQIEINTQGIFQAGIRTASGSTATTGDIRGTFRPPVDCDGSKVFQLLVALPDSGYTGIDQFAG